MTTEKKDPWVDAVIKSIKTELLKKDMTYNDVIDRLVEMGIQETSAGLRTKMSRGVFRATYFLQLLCAMDVKELSLDTDFLKIAKNKTKTRKKEGV